MATKHLQGTATTAADILVSESDGVLRIRFNRPQARNALTLDMYRVIREAIAAIRLTGSVRAVVFSGVGGQAFASGTDIGEFRAFASGQDALDYEAMIETTLAALERCPVPTIAYVNGVAAGGGFAIAACCDMRIASHHARFAMPMARTLGNTLSVKNHARLAGLIGRARLRQLILTADFISADEALCIGFVTQISQADPALEQCAELEAMVQRVVAHAPLTMLATKRALTWLANPEAAVSQADLDEALIRMTYESADFKEGVAAFLAKRRPVWQGR